MASYPNAQVGAGGLIQTKRVGHPVRDLINNPQSLAVIFCLLHIPLGLVLRGSPQAATIHAYISFAIGVWVAASKMPIHRTVYVLAYIAGSETMWRVIGAQIFWEFGKYATIPIIMIALFRNRYTRVPLGPLYYFILLIPSTLLAILDQGAKAFGQISFNMSGPLAILACCWLFSYIKLSKDQFEKMLLGFIAPAISMAVVALVHLLQTANIVWTYEANGAASGGLGPDQVSSLFGLAVLATFLLVVSANTAKSVKILLVITGLWLVVQAFLTFGRGGVFTMVLVLVVLLFHLLRTRKQRTRALIALIWAIIAYLLVIGPALNDLTNGAFEHRFTDLGSTQRDKIAEADLDLFLQNPITGVGTGLSSNLRTDILGFYVAPHTEYTRLLAEHGIMGGAAMLIMVAISFRNYRKTKGKITRAVVGAFLAWAFLFMAHSAIRVVSVPLLIGFSFADLSLDSPEKPKTS